LRRIRLKSAAELGKPEAMGSFASFLLFQRDADPVKAVFWAMKAAEAGNAEGQVIFAELSFEDTKYYVSLFLIQRILAWAYRFGLGGLKSDARAAAFW